MDVVPIFNLIGQSKIFKGGLEIAQPQNFQDLVAAFSLRARFWGEAVRARAGGGQARRGATALSNKQQGEKGSAAKGGGRGEDWLLGQGRREGLRHARGQVAGDPSASETRSSCGRS